MSITRLASGILSAFRLSVLIYSTAQANCLKADSQHILCMMKLAWSLDVSVSTIEECDLDESFSIAHSHFGSRANLKCCMSGFLSKILSKILVGVCKVVMSGAEGSIPVLTP